jgi:hypothetical protein
MRKSSICENLPNENLPHLSFRVRQEFRSAERCRRGTPRMLIRSNADSGISTILSFYSFISLLQFLATSSQRGFAFSMSETFFSRFHDLVCVSRFVPPCKTTASRLIDDVTKKTHRPKPVLGVTRRVSRLEGKLCGELQLACRARIAGWEAG